MDKVQGPSILCCLHHHKTSSTHRAGLWLKQAAQGCEQTEELAAPNTALLETGQLQISLREYFLLEQMPNRDVRSSQKAQQGTRESQI